MASQQIADLTEVNDVTFGDWQKDYLYQLMVIDEPKDPNFAALKGGIDPKTLDAYCDAFPLPNSKQNTIKRRWAGKWFVGSSRLDPTTVVEGQWRMDESNNLYKYINAWHQLSGDDDSDQSSQKAMYVGKVALILYYSDKTTVGRGYLLHNAWFPEIGDLNLDKTKDGYLVFSASIAYDKKSSYTP